MDVTQALKDTENTLRDFIANVLHKKFGDAWVDKCGVSDERINRWKERKLAEEKRQESGVVEERLIYYADFYDLKNILKKRWSGEFSAALGDWKTMEVWLTELEKLRDPDAHRRELLPHQKHLVLGVAGEIRTRLIRYRSKQETSEDYFPRIECVRDSLGNICTKRPGIRTGMTLRPGDALDYVVTASDPLGADLQYRLISAGSVSRSIGWQPENIFSLQITSTEIRKLFHVQLQIRSPRDYHARGDYDDVFHFYYSVLPAKQ